MLKFLTRYCFAGPLLALCYLPSSASWTTIIRDPLLALGYLPTCPTHRGRPFCCLSGRLRWRGFCIQSHSRHPGPGPPRNALRRRPSWCGNDSTGPARQLGGGSRAFHQQIRGTALERRGTKSSALRRVREHIRSREANAAHGTVTQLEACLVSEIKA